MALFRQASFVGGEIAPSLYGRSDVAKWHQSLKTCRNFFPSAQGRLISRPGTKYVAAAKSYHTNNSIRLWPFICSDTDTYVLEMGQGYIRFFRGGTPVLAGGMPYELVSPYTGDMSLLRFAQVGDRLYITGNGYAPRMLTRLSDVNWTLSNVPFSAPGPTFDSATNAATPPTLLTASILPEDVAGGMPNREWTWKVTAVIQDDSAGLFYETLPFTVINKSDFGGTPPTLVTLGTDKFAVYPSKPITIRWPTLATAATTTGHILSWRVYRGRGKLFGFVGETTSREFIDVGDPPNYAVQPPEGRNPFQVFNLSATLVRTETPAAVALFDQRLVFGGTVERPGWVWASAVGDWSNFDVHLFGGEADAVEFELASLRREDIRSLVGLDKLFALTSGGVWSIEDIGAGDIIPKARKQTDEGASAALPPIVTRDTLLYVRSKGSGINELNFEQERQKYGLADLSILSRHLFDGHSIVDWCYAHDPYQLVWAVRDDGVLLCLTYDREQEVWAWSRHDTAGGAVKAVCAIPEGAEDAVYIFVSRVIGGGGVGYYIERMASRRFSDVAEDAVCVDAAVHFDYRYNSVGTPVTLSNQTSWSTDGLVDITTSAFPLFTSTDVGQQFVILGGPTVLVRLTITGYTSATRVRARLEMDAPLSIRGIPQAVFAFERNKVSGLSHLEGATVSATADGYAITGLTVTGGAVTLPGYYMRGWVGLPFTPEAQFLDIAADKAEIRATQKTVNSLSVEVESSRGFQVGPDLDHLVEPPERSVLDGYNPPPLFTGHVPVNIPGGWEYAGGAAIRQVDPLPCTVLAVTRDVTIGGK